MSNCALGFACGVLAWMLFNLTLGQHIVEVWLDKRTALAARWKADAERALADARAEVAWILEQQHTLDDALRRWESYREECLDHLVKDYGGKIEKDER